MTATTLKRQPHGPGRTRSPEQLKALVAEGNAALGPDATATDVARWAATFLGDLG